MVGPYPAPGERIRGGVEAVIEALRRALAGSVHLNIVVPGAAEDETAVVDGCPIHYVARTRGPGVLRYWSRDAWRVAERVARLKPDLVHLQAAAAAGLFIRAPKVLTVHGIMAEDIRHGAAKLQGISRLGIGGAIRLASAMERRGSASCRHLIVINPYVIEALPHLAGMPQTLLPNPLNPAFVNPPPEFTGERPPVLVVAGHICKRKNTLGVLELFAAMKGAGSPARLVLCGSEESEPDYARKCREFVQANSLAGEVLHRGNLAPHELAAEFDRSFGLLMLSLQETAPMVVAEAQARGLPVFAPARFGLKSMIEHGRNGCHIPGGPDVPNGGTREAQAQALMAAMGLGFNRPTLRMGAIETYSAGRIANATLQVYEAALAGGAKAPPELATAGADIVGNKPRATIGATH